MACVITLENGQQIIPDTYTLAGHQVTVEATQFPVDDGQSVTDHAIVKPDTVQLDLLFTPGAGNEELDPPPSDNRPLYAWQLLKATAKARSQIGVVVDGEIYNPALIVGFSWQHVFEDGNSRRVSLQVQQVLVATSQTVPASSLGIPLQHSGKRASKGNTQQGTPPTPFQKEVMASLAWVLGQ